MYNHLTLQMYDPTLAPQATMWGHADIPTIHNRGAVADPAEWLMIHMAGDVIRVLCGRFFGG